MRFVANNIVSSSFTLTYIFISNTSISIIANNQPSRPSGFSDTFDHSHIKSLHFLRFANYLWRVLGCFQNKIANDLRGHEQGYYWLKGHRVQEVVTHEQNYNITITNHLLGANSNNTVRFEELIKLSTTTIIVWKIIAIILKVFNAIAIILKIFSTLLWLSSKSRPRSPWSPTQVEKMDEASGNWLPAAQPKGTSCELRNLVENHK